MTDDSFCRRLRLDRLIAATVVLVLVLAASAAYYRLSTLKK